MKSINIYRTIIAWIVLILVILNCLVFHLEQIRWFCFGIDFMIISECVVESICLLKGKNDIYR